MNFSKLNYWHCSIICHNTSLLKLALASVLTPLQLLNISLAVIVYRLCAETAIELNPGPSIS